MTIKQIQDEITKARYQRQVALEKCNVSAAEHYLQRTLWLLTQLQNARRALTTNRTAAYFAGAGI